MAIDFVTGIRVKESTSTIRLATFLVVCYLRQISINSRLKNQPIWACRLQADVVAMTNRSTRINKALPSIA